MDLIKGGATLLSAAVKQIEQSSLGGFVKDNTPFASTTGHYNVKDWYNSNPLSRYMMSAVGGGLGGPVNI